MTNSAFILWMNTSKFAHDVHDFRFQGSYAHLVNGSNSHPTNYVSIIKGLRESGKRDKNCIGIFFLIALAVTLFEGPYHHKINTVNLDVGSCWIFTFIVQTFYHIGSNYTNFAFLIDI